MDGRLDRLGPIPWPVVTPTRERRVRVSLSLVVFACRSSVCCDCAGLPASRVVALSVSGTNSPALAGLPSFGGGVVLTRLPPPGPPLTPKRGVGGGGP
jgi:hypothetical protein